MRDFAQNAFPPPGSIHQIFISIKDKWRVYWDSIVPSIRSLKTMQRMISLAAYLVRVRDVKERENEILSDFYDDEDLLLYLNEQLGSMKQAKHNEISQKVLTVSTLQKADRRLIGIIETGEYGIESKIYSVSERRVVHRRKEGEADMLPFYFMFEIPEKTEVGFLILQRTGNYGIRHTLSQFIKDSFDISFEDLKFRLEPIVDEQQVEKYSHGLVQEIRFVKVNLPADLEDQYDSGHTEVRGQMELTIKARRKGSLPLQKYVASLIRKQQRSGIFAIDEGNFEYNNVKLKTKVNGTSRIFEVGDPKLRSYHDITGVVKIGRGGHPTFDSVNEAAEKLVDRLRRQMFGSSSNEN